MYKVTIITKYNTINMECEDLNSPEMVEIFAQPYIIEIRAEQMGKVKTLSPNEYRKRYDNGDK